MKKGVLMTENEIVICPQCNAKNRIPNAQTLETAKCGRCQAALIGAKQGPPEVVLTLRCSHCHTKNRVPAGKLHAGAKCGRCGKALQHQDVNNGRPVMVTDTNFEQTVLQSPLPVLLYSWAPWCSVCGSTGPQVDQLAGEARGKIRVGKLNVDTNPQLASRFNILSVPSFFIFDSGQFKEHIAGGVPKQDLMLKMAPYL